MAQKANSFDSSGPLNSAMALRSMLRAGASISANVRMVRARRGTLTRAEPSHVWLQPTRPMARSVSTSASLVTRRDTCSPRPFPAVPGPINTASMVLASAIQCPSPDRAWAGLKAPAQGLCASHFPTTAPQSATVSVTASENCPEACKLWSLSELDGSSGPLLVQDDTKAKFVFKPSHREPTGTMSSSESDTKLSRGSPLVSESPLLAKKRGIEYGQTATRELLAYLMDHEGWAKVPRTDVVSAELHGDGAQSTATICSGSLQQYVNNIGTADDYGASKFSAEDVHRIGIFDIRLANLDRHLANLLVTSGPTPDPSAAAKGATTTRKSNKNLHLVPIDHSYVLPDFRDLSDVTFEWQYWRQCAVPFSSSSVEYVANLDPLRDAALVRGLGLPNAQAVTAVLMCECLREMVRAGLTLRDIAKFVARQGCGEQPSAIEKLIQKSIAALQKDAACERVLCGTRDPASAFAFFESESASLRPNAPLKLFLCFFKRGLVEEAEAIKSKVRSTTESKTRGLHNR